LKLDAFNIPLSSERVGHQAGGCVYSIFVGGAT